MTMTNTEIPVVRRPDGRRDDAREYGIGRSDVGRWVVIQSGYAALAIGETREIAVALAVSMVEADLVDAGQVNDGECFVAEVELGTETEEDC